MFARWALRSIDKSWDFGFVRKSMVVGQYIFDNYGYARIITTHLGALKCCEGINYTELTCHTSISAALISKRNIVRKLEKPGR